MRRLRRRYHRPPLVAVFVTAFTATCSPWCAPPCYALTVNVVYNPVTSEGPGNDPTGTDLMAVVQAAADRWETMILDPWTVTIDISWQQPADMFNGGALAEGISTASLIGKPTNGYVRFNNTKDFFFDPTPLEDEEFNMQQTLYRDIDPILQPAWFGGSVPQVLEAGYRGGAFGGQASDVYDTDLFSVAMHEIGHVLGMNAEVNSPQVDDGDYDVNPAFVGGASMSIDDSDEHLPIIDAAMYPSIGSGTRKRISATDLFAIASAVNWASVNARRKDFLGGPDFADPTSWLSGRVPNALDDAYVRKNDALPPFTVASAGMSFGNLSVLEGSWVTTDHVFNVLGSAVINGDGSVGGDSRVRIQSNGTLFADSLLIDSNGTLELLDGFADIDADVFISIGGLLKGSGAVLVDDRLTNNGLISANGVQTLILTTTSPDAVAVWDLDGSGGVVEAINGDIFIHGTHFGDFSGNMNIGAGHEIVMDRAWTLAADGFLNLHGATNDPADLHAEPATLLGTVDVDKDGAVKGPTTFKSPVLVKVNDTSDRLFLQGPTTFDGGTYIGNGDIVQQADITVDSDTTLDTGRFSWGNSANTVSNDITVEPGATFTINSPKTGPAGNAYRGVIRIHNGAMEVNTDSSWTLPAEVTAGDNRFPRGTLILEDRKGGFEPTLRGQRLLLHGLLQTIGGPGSVEAELYTNPTAEIDVRVQTELKLKGATRYNGGNIHGGGTLRQFGDALVVGNTTINTSFMDWDGDEANPSDTTIQPGVIFTIQSEHIEENPLTEGYSGHVTVSDNAALVVITDITWLIDGQMTLLGQPTATPQAIVDGSPVGNFGLVEGNGWFQNTFANVGTVRPGLSAGAMRMASLVMYNESVFEFEVGGDSPIMFYDQVNVDSTTILNGTLDVALINGYIPPIGAGTQYDIINAGSPLIGLFDTVLLPPMLKILYQANTVSLITGLPGDLNGDGFVGIEDLNIVLSNWNQNTNSGDWAGGDPSGDGFVGIADLNTVLGNWNNGTPPLESLTGIPEPASITALAVSGLTLLRRPGMRRRTYRKATPPGWRG